MGLWPWDPLVFPGTRLQAARGPLLLIRDSGLAFRSDPSVFPAPRYAAHVPRFGTGLFLRQPSSFPSWPPRWVLCHVPWCLAFL